MPCLIGNAASGGYLRAWRRRKDDQGADAATIQRSTDDILRASRISVAMRIPSGT